jgi:hypothetical protein
MALVVCEYCRHEISDAAPACIHCGRPGVANLGGSTSIVETATLRSSEPVVDSAPSSTTDDTFFAPIAIHKLLIMSCFTLGLYEIHWFYKQWDYIRRIDRKRFNPALRAILNGIFAYPLFRSIRLRGLAKQAEIGWSPALLTLIWFGMVVLSLFTVRVLEGLATALPLVVVQQSINRLNNPSSLDRRFSVINVVGIVAGSVIFLLIGIGTYRLLTASPSPRSS